MEASIPASSLPNATLDASANLDDALDRLAAAVRTGDMQNVANAMKDVDDSIDRLVALARALAAQTDDPDQRKALLEAADALEDLKPHLRKAAADAVAHPHDKEAADRLADLIQEAKQRNMNLAAAANPNLEEDILRGGAAIMQGMKDVMNSLKDGDVAGALEKMNELEEEMRKQAIRCKVLGSTTSDRNKRRMLLEAAMAMQNNLFSMLDDIRNALLRGDHDTAQELLQRLFRETFSITDKTENLLNPQPESSSSEEPQDEIMQAARHVQSVVNAPDKIDIDDSTAEGRIYSAARAIAHEMALMSDAAARGVNSEIIVISRRIHQHVQMINRNCREVADMCTDNILKEQVMSVAHAISNISVQLKIITAVKAAGGEGDTTVKAQLVKCAKGLASNVVNVCNAIEIASIRFMM